MANLGAQCWIAFKDGLYKQWSASMTAEDNERAESWRQEGRLSAMETLKARMASAETAMAQLATAEGRLTALRESMEAETNRRVAEALESKLKDAEILHLRELSSFRERLAYMDSKDATLSMLRETNTALQTTISIRETQLAEKDAQLQIIADSQKTKSSYAIGKQGEAVVMEMLNKYVIPSFLHSSAHDVTGKGHVADIHLFLQSPVGKMMKILVEAKQYSRAVKTKEIGKLHNDVDADDEALAGIMISTSSQIASVKQFQIEKTSKGKYVLYLSVDGFDDEFRGMIVCWAIRVLSTLATYSADSSDNLVGKIVDFFTELEKSVQEADLVVKNCQKATDSAISMKRSLSKRLEDFRQENLKLHAVSSVSDITEMKSVVKPTIPSSPIIEEEVEEITVDLTTEDGESIITPKLSASQKSSRKYYEENRERLLKYAKEARSRKRAVKKSLVE
jgi:hypothetical protein